MRILLNACLLLASFQVWAESGVSFKADNILAAYDLTPAKSALGTTFSLRNAERLHISFDARWNKVRGRRIKPEAVEASVYGRSGNILYTGRWDILEYRGEAPPNLSQSKRLAWISHIPARGITAKSASKTYRSAAALSSLPELPDLGKVAVSILVRSGKTLMKLKVGRTVLQFIR